MAADRPMAQSGGKRCVSKSLNCTRRIGTPDDVVYLALYLASDESAWMAGAVTLIDGGWTNR